MSSKSARRYAASVATCVAVTEKLSLSYSEKPGCSQFKLDVRKLNKKSCEFLRMSIKGFDAKDIEKVADVTAKCSENGLDSTRSWRVLLTYMMGLLNNRYNELEEHGGCPEKMRMVEKLDKMSKPLWDHFSSKNKREDFDDDGVKLMEIFESCWL